MVKIVCISDTHQNHEQLALLGGGDILVHAGDFCSYGYMDEVKAFARWAEQQPFTHKIVVAGNHDEPLYEEGYEEAERLLKNAGILYLEDSAVDVGGLRFYGFPWTVSDRNFNYRAFGLTEGEFEEKLWDVPEHVDVFIAHGPPEGFRDFQHDRPSGSSSLREALLEIRPKLLVCGHVHTQYGQETIEGIHVVNAATCNMNYVATNNPIEVELCPR